MVEEDTDMTQSKSTLADAVSACSRATDQIAECTAQLQALLAKQDALQQAQRLLEHRTLTEVIKKPLGYHNGRPVAALLIHRCLLRWDFTTSKDPATQTLLDNIIQVISQELDEDHINQQLEALKMSSAHDLASSSSFSFRSAPQSPRGANGTFEDPQSNLSSGATTLLGHFSYWLCVTSTLLALIHRIVPQHPSHVRKPPPTQDNGKAASTSASAANYSLAAPEPPQPPPAPMPTVAKLVDFQSKLAKFGKGLLKKGLAPPPNPFVTEAVAKAKPVTTEADLFNRASVGPDAVFQPDKSHTGRMLAANSSNMFARASAPCGYGNSSNSISMAPAHPPAHHTHLSATSAKPPTFAQIFRRDLDGLVQESFRHVRDALKKQVTHLLPSCIHAQPPDSPRVSMDRETDGGFGGHMEGMEDGRGEDRDTAYMPLVAQVDSKAGEVPASAPPPSQPAQPAQQQQAQAQGSSEVGGEAAEGAGAAAGAAGGAPATQGPQAKGALCSAFMCTPEAVGLALGDVAAGGSAVATRGQESKEGQGEGCGGVVANVEPGQAEGGSGEISGASGELPAVVKLPLNYSVHSALSGHSGHRSSGMGSLGSCEIEPCEEEAAPAPAPRSRLQSCQMMMVDDEDDGPVGHVEGVGAADAANAAALRPWTDLVSALQAGLRGLREAHMSRILIKCAFKQVLGYIDVQLFNQLLLRPECCCKSNAKTVLGGLDLLDGWIGGADDALMRPLLLEMRHVRQAAKFLASPKTRLTPRHITTVMCPALNAQQVYRLATTYWDDTPMPCPHVTPPPVSLHNDGGGAAKPPPMRQPDMVSGEVLEALKAGSREGGGGVVGNGGLIVTFLLDEDHAPIIAPGGFIAPEVLSLVEGGTPGTPSPLYAPMDLPTCMDTPDIPRHVFEFVMDDVTPPAPAKAPGGGGDMFSRGSYKG